MNRAKDLLSNTVILALGKFLPQITALITLPIYTGMLSSTEYGRYDLINTIVYILDILILVQIHQAVFRFLLDVREKRDQDAYITTTFAFELIPSLLAAAVFVLFYRELPFPTPLLLGYYLFINLQYSVVGQVARGLGNTRAYSIGAVIQAVLNMLLVVLLVAKIELGFVGLFLSLNAAYTAACVYQFIACRQWKYIRAGAFDKGALREMIAYAWPMVPNTLSIWLVNTCNKFLIRLFMGLEYNGIFAVAQKIPNIFTMAYSTFNMAWQESAAKSVNDEDHDSYYGQVFSALFDFLTGSILLLISFTPILFAVLIHGDYDQAYNQIPLLYIGVFFSCISSFYGSIYIARKATKLVGISSTLAAAANAVINLCLIHWLGLYAASLSTIVSYLVLSGYRCRQIERRSLARITYNKKRIAFCFALIVLSCILCYQQRLATNLINGVIAVVGFFGLNRTLIKGVLTAVFSKLKRARKAK